MSGVEQVRENLASLASHLHDNDILRWTMAERSDGELEGKLRHYLQWRKRRGVDLLLDCWKPPEVLRKYFPGGLAGFDNSGSPVWIIPIGRVDIQGLLACVSRDEILDYGLRMVETSLQLMREKSASLGHPVLYHVVIIDMFGLNLQASTLLPLVKIVQTFLCLYEEHYPHTLKSVHILNTNPVMKTMFRITKRFFLNKNKIFHDVQVYGSSDWEKSLRQLVPEEVLPPLWGGSNTSTSCPDIEASEFGTIGLGGQVPLYYQTVQKHKDIPGMEDTNTLVILRRSTFTLRYTIKERCTLRWRFKSEGGKIGFGVQRRRCFRPVTFTEKMSSFKLNRIEPQRKSVPDIQINDETAQEIKPRRPKLGHHFEVFEEIDEAGSFVEDQKVHPETIIKTHLVGSDEETQLGLLECLPGYSYMMIFTNKNSCFTSRKLIYGIQVDLNEKHSDERVSNQSSVPASELVAFVKDLLELEKLKDKAGEKESSSTSSSVASNCPLLDNQTPGSPVIEVHSKF